MPMSFDLTAASANMIGQSMHSALGPDLIGIIDVLSGTQTVALIVYEANPDMLRHIQITREATAYLTYNLMGDLFDRVRWSYGRLVRINTSLDAYYGDALAIASSANDIHVQNLAHLRAIVPRLDDMVAMMSSQGDLLAFILNELRRGLIVFGLGIVTFELGRSFTEADLGTIFKIAALALAVYLLDVALSGLQDTALAFSWTLMFMALSIGTTAVALWLLNNSLAALTLTVFALSVGGLLLSDVLVVVSLAFAAFALTVELLNSSLSTLTGLGFLLSGVLLFISVTLGVAAAMATLLSSALAALSPAGLAFIGVGFALSGALLLVSLALGATAVMAALLNGALTVLKTTFDELAAAINQFAGAIDTIDKDKLDGIRTSISELTFSINQLDIERLKSINENFKLLAQFIFNIENVLDQFPKKIIEAFDSLGKLANGLGVLVNSLIDLDAGKLKIIEEEGFSRLLKFVKDMGNELDTFSDKILRVLPPLAQLFKALADIVNVFNELDRAGRSIRRFLRRP